MLTKILEASGWQPPQIRNRQNQLLPFRLHHGGKDADGDGAEDDEEAEAGRDFYVWHIG